MDWTGARKPVHNIGDTHSDIRRHRPARDFNIPTIPELGQGRLLILFVSETFGDAIFPYVYIASLQPTIPFEILLMALCKQTDSNRALTTPDHTKCGCVESAETQDMFGREMDLPVC